MAEAAYHNPIQFHSSLDFVVDERADVFHRGEDLVFAFFVELVVRFVDRGGGPSDGNGKE